jgi:AraC-like DNA-binding protein
MDVLSELLKVVRLEGALFFNGEFSAPWCFSARRSEEIAPHLAPSADHLVIYHLVTQGSGYARLPEGEAIELNAGDVVFFPHGDAHIIGNGVAEPVDSLKSVAMALAQHLEVFRSGGGGEVTRFVCGYMACDGELCQPILACLPPMVKINIRNDAGGQWIENSIRFAVTQAAAERAGGDALVAKLAEVLFVETLQRYMISLPAEQTGWLAGARDPLVSRTLALLHREPANDWTIAELAEKVGTSRSVLADRFRHYLGQPPMAYLANWRMHLGARMLKQTSRSVVQVASGVGYESEAAFNRAFKRQFGVPPAQYRKKNRGARREVEQQVGA